MAKLRQQNSELRVLLISGYHNPKDAKPDLSVELIRKPFASSALIERVGKFSIARRIHDGCNRYRSKAASAN